VSDWLLIDQHRVDTFADAHGRSPMDPCRCRTRKATPFLGGTIAHGFP